MDKVEGGKTRLIANLENSEPSNDAIPFMAEKGYFTRIISIITSTHHFPLCGHNLKLCLWSQRDHSIILESLAHFIYISRFQQVFSLYKENK